MVVRYPSSENTLIEYYSLNESRITRELLDAKKSCRIEIPAGNGGIILIYDGLTPKETLEYLVKIWNENKGVNSSELLLRIISIAQKNNFELKFEIR